MGCNLNLLGVGEELNEVREIGLDSMKLSEMSKTLRRKDSERRADQDKTATKPFLKLYMEGRAKWSCKSSVLNKMLCFRT